MVEEIKEKKRKACGSEKGKRKTETAKDNTVGAKIPKSAVAGVNLIQSKDKNIRYDNSRKGKLYTIVVVSFHRAPSSRRAGWTIVRPSYHIPPLHPSLLNSGSHGTSYFILS